MDYTDLIISGVHVTPEFRQRYGNMYTGKIFLRSTYLEITNLQLTLKLRKNM